MFPWAVPAILKKLSVNMFNTFIARMGYKATSAVLIVALFFWLSGLPSWIGLAEAVSLINVSDTLQDSAPSNPANNTIVFNTPTGVANGGAVTIAFQSGFDVSSILFSDIDVATTSGEFSLAADCTGSEMASAAVVSQDLIITFCSGDGGLLQASATATIKIGTNATFQTTGANRIVNPSTIGSYVLFATAGIDVAEFRVAIVNNVTVTASVSTSFTFVIKGLATSTAVNGDTTTGSTSPNIINFSTTTPGSAKVMGQQLEVTTNAVHGFIVTVQENQNLLSSSGADIDLFKDGAMTAIPIAWASPAGILDAEETYGHFGVTSDDADLNGGEFSGTTYAGNFSATNTPRQVFSHAGPSDGTTQNKGMAKVAYKLEISALQEAAPDYTNTLTYVATPTF